MNSAIRFWFFIMFWGYWVGYFLFHKGFDEGLANKHPVWWWIFIIATLLFYVGLQEYLDFNLPGPEPTPCLMAIFVGGIFVGRHMFPGKSIFK